MHVLVCVCSDVRRFAIATSSWYDPPPGGSISVAPWVANPLQVCMLQTVMGGLTLDGDPK